MEKKFTKKAVVLFMLCGMLGCILIGASDYLMIWGDTAYEGKLAFLTLGTAAVPASRNALALGLAFPAVVLYSIALFGLVNFLKDGVHQKAYTYLTGLGLTPWLCLHLFYIMIFYVYAWATKNGNGDFGIAAGEALYTQFSWVILLAEVFMLAPFIYWFYLTVAKKSMYGRWMAVNNPLIWYVVLKGITLAMPDTPFRLAFTNGLMSEAMFIWFFILMIAGLHAVTKEKES